MKGLNIGLFGFGCVGKGVYDILQEHPKTGINLTKVCIKNKNKPRSASNVHFTTDRNELLFDENINVIIELIDDAAAAFDIVRIAMEQGKSVISANKKMIAEHFNELLKLQNKHQVAFLYDAAVCGSIPIIRNLEEYYHQEETKEITSICNGTANYILTKTVQENRTYKSVLVDAQNLGFAESDPTLDVQGFDAKYKLIIMVAHTFGAVLKPEEVLNYGIHHLSSSDIAFAQAHDYRIKLFAQARYENERLIAYVAPHFVPKTSQFYHVENEYNAVQVNTKYADTQFLVGKGAGSYPTATAVLSDVYGLQRNYNYHQIAENKTTTYFDDNQWVNVYLRYENDDFLNRLNLKNTRFNQLGDAKSVVAEVNLKDLLAANLNNQSGIFIGFLPEKHEVFELATEGMLATIA